MNNLGICSKDIEWFYTFSFLVLTFIIGDLFLLLKFDVLRGGASHWMLTSYVTWASPSIILARISLAVLGVGYLLGNSSKIVYEKISLEFLRITEESGAGSLSLL